MDYEKFTKALYLNVLSREETAGKAIKIEEEELCIYWKFHDKEYAVCWSLKELYIEFLQHDWPGVMDKIVQRLHLKVFLQKFSVTLRPMNYNEYRAEIQDGIYCRFGEIALVVYATVYENREEYVMSYVSHKEIWKRKIGFDFLWEETLNIVCKKRPPRLYYGTEPCWMQNGDKGVFMPDEHGEQIVIRSREAENGLCGYRLTVLGYTYGAMALFYPGVCERLGELFDGDFYVGFISVHEAVVHPVRYKVLGEMKTSIIRINAQSDCRERLTNQVYRYCGGQKRLVEV